jgi:hypothetical protein
LDSACGLAQYNPLSVSSRKAHGDGLVHVQSVLGAIPALCGIFGNGVLHVRRSEGRRFLGSRRLDSVLSVYSISENALVW